MKGNRTGVISVHCNLSGKSCSGKANIGDIVSQGTFKQIYDVGSLDKFSRRGTQVRNN